MADGLAKAKIDDTPEDKYRAAQSQWLRGLQYKFAPAERLL